MLGKVPVGPTDPKPATCPHCDFGTGQRGMDSCGKCDGVGSVFFVNGKMFPNTKEGYIAACQEKGVVPVLE